VLINAVWYKPAPEFAAFIGKVIQRFQHIQQTWTDMMNDCAVHIQQDDCGRF
jgi:hypothetical protein